ncbi:hypothetical protein IFM89_010991 [Coptis chinensis]|uniref:Dolichyl-diphosphooligosaccharide--protein glycosyltransferase 48 kDa subunit n=2 Tax=Magnoliopsida TaxID=3398 RepID=A0A835IM45_9MAGN|nr:hypothetical protein IFM89_010991 [Coptis chinensis]
MSNHLSIIFLILILLPFLTQSFSPKKVLILLDDFSLKSSHSLYFTSLKNRNYHLDFHLATDSNLKLSQHGEYLYDGLILFSPTVQKFGGSLDLNSVLGFVDSGRNLILAVDESASDLVKEIATECGVDFDEDSGAVVIDHGSFADGDHMLIASDDFIDSDVILGKEKIEAPVLFKGIGHALNPVNSQVLKVLSASPWAYSANPESKLSSPPSLTGSRISLVSVVQTTLSRVAKASETLCLVLPDNIGFRRIKAIALFSPDDFKILQARNNARILISGSLDLFSNRLFKSGVQKAGSSTNEELMGKPTFDDRYLRSGNEQFTTELSRWVFNERGHLKAVNVRHNKVGETVEPSMYRITDDLEYSVEIYEWSGTSWEPYVSDDVQIQFYMMSPYVLKTLATDKKGLYYTSFKVPDVYGVFQFKVEYHKLGYTSLSLAKQIPVRPFRHNEYERFLTAAFPYYGASFSTMAGFFVFSIIYLYNK